MIVVNFKAYEEATGENAARVGHICDKVARETEEEIIVCTSAPDLLRVEHLDTKLFAQHIDPVDPGSHTGSVTAREVKAAGATGTLINHSEKRLEPETIQETVEKAREEDLTTIVCAQSPEECEQFAEFKPDYIAYEPPELIGGDVSVSDAQPELINEAVEKSGNVPTLTGAGIKNSKDVKKSLELGCEGVLIASGVVKSSKPYEDLLELANQ